MVFFRRRRRTETDSSAGESSNLRQSSSASRLTSFSLARSVSRTSTLPDEGAKAPKGPLGLSLLHLPEDAEVDLIFVHGLGGDSKKTWSKSSVEGSFWPQDWLPQDEAFENVRIHTYGYASDYLKGKEDCLNIHHIGKSFLGEISTSPQLTNSKTRLIFIGHSMGGLVIKKACILAAQDSAHKALASRIAAVYFLATPHRGADSAKLLSNILKAVHERAYVADLGRNSAAIQIINDEFRHVSENIELWSFYETQCMKYFNSLIVDPESAILGYPQEQQMPMSADHRTICKFDSVLDPKYSVIRNALVSTITKICNSNLTTEVEKKPSQIKDIKKYLGLLDGFEDDFTTLREMRMSGSCQWVTNKSTYKQWQDGQLNDGKILWIRGKPATGKSVLAGYAIDQLCESGKSCSYFFFKHGDKTKSGLSVCLRTLAFQMACSDISIQDAILGMREDGVQLATLEIRTLWRILFTNGIFRQNMSEHFWVIDAVDESANSSAFADLILGKIDSAVTLKVLFTSRDTAELDQSISSLPQGSVLTISVSAEETISDHELVIENRMRKLAVVDRDEGTLLKERILSKSKGSFLWTTLVLKELLNCHSKNEIDSVLDDVPRGMLPLYKRTLDLMSQGIRGKELSKAILMWVSCAIRPLSLDELGYALEIELGDKFPKLEESITALCGQLVIVDKSGKIHMVHETAREFLLNEDLDSEFAINIQKAHTRIASTCLQYLIGDEMKPPRIGRKRILAKQVKRVGFAIYANTAYSYHLSRADPKTPELFQLTSQFTKSNILSWIEVATARQDLNQLIRVSKQLRSYVEACCVERSPLDLQIQSLRQWVVDLVRIATKFGSALILSPSAIYSLIPPFCPTQSMIYNTGSPNQKLIVLGRSSTQWDDRLSTLDFGKSLPNALCYGNEFLAIGMTTGSVALYDATSYQEHKLFDHGEPVKFIRFKNKSAQIVTCGTRSTKIWDIRSGEILHRLKSPPRPLDMAFDGDSLLVASNDSHLTRWVLREDALESKSPWKDSPTTDSLPSRLASVAAISVTHKMLAVAYAGKPVVLWDLEENAYFGNCGKTLANGTTSTHVVVALAFNPNPSLGLLAVAYLDGDLALLDPFENRQLECLRSTCHNLASSPDGRLLAAGAANGIIQIYEFDTLRLLYSVKSPGSQIIQINFNRGGFRFADIRASRCTIWEPTALPRHSLSEESSVTTSSSVAQIVSLDAHVKVSAIEVHDKARVIFCGRDDGAVLLYCGDSASCLGTLYTHKTRVRLLRWCGKQQAIMSIDAANRIFFYKVWKSPSNGWLADPNPLFHAQLESEMAITDVLIETAESKFLVSTQQSDYMFNFDGTKTAERSYKDNLSRRKWSHHPTSSRHLICIDNDDAFVYSWEDWVQNGTFHLPINNNIIQPKSLNFYTLERGSKMLIEFSKRDSSTRTVDIMLFDTSCFAIGLDAEDVGEDISQKSSPQTGRNFPSVSERLSDETSSQRIAPLFRSQTAELGALIFHLIGIKDTGELVFLDHSSWVCSIDLKIDGVNKSANLGSGDIEYYRHCFIPHDWFAGRREIVCTILKTDLIFARGGDLAVIKGYSNYKEKVYL